MPDKASFSPDDSDPPDLAERHLVETVAMLRANISLLLKPEARSKISEMLGVGAREDEFTRDLSELMWGQIEVMNESRVVASQDAYSFNREGYNMHSDLGEGLLIHTSLPKVNDELEIQPATITAGNHKLGSCQAVYAFLKAYVPISKQLKLLWDVVEWYRCFMWRKWHSESFHTGILSEDLKPLNEHIREVLDGKK